MLAGVSPGWCLPCRSQGYHSHRLTHDTSHPSAHTEHTGGQRRGAGQEKREGKGGERDEEEMRGGERRGKERRQGKKRAGRREEKERDEKRAREKERGIGDCQVIFGCAYTFTHPELFTVLIVKC